MIALDDQSGRPLYRQVADALRVKIEQRDLEPGRQLPTEARLMERYGVSRNTVRLALGVLRSEGLVVTGQGRGSFVADLSVEADDADHDGAAPRRIRARHGAVTVPIDLTETRQGETVEVAVATRSAPEPVAQRLRVTADDRVVERRRLHLRGGAPSHTADSYLAADVAADSPLTSPAPLRVGLLEVFASLGRTVERHEDEVAVRMPTPGEAQQLQIATGVPVLALLRTAFDDHDVPVCVTVALLPGDRHVLRYELLADSDAE